MANIKSIINMDNKEVIAGKKTQVVNCNCNSNQCQITNILYKAKLHQILKTIMEK